MNNTNGKIDVWVFDIDGTLADHKHRGPYEEHKVHTDEPIIPVVKVLQSLAKDYAIIFVSGRTEGCMQNTSLWLTKHTGIERPILYMRGINDKRMDSIVKKEIYDTYITPNFNILGVFDDRMQVCRMLYENEIFCFNVNQGLKEF
jgi:hypothetical protein